MEQAQTEIRMSKSERNPNAECRRMTAEDKACQSRNRIARSVWSAWSLLPLSNGAGHRKREQAPRTPNASRPRRRQECAQSAGNFGHNRAKYAEQALSARGDYSAFDGLEPLVRVSGFIRHSFPLCGIIRPSHPSAY